MKNRKKLVKIILLIILITGISCGSRKKQVTKEKVKTEILVQVDSTSTTEKEKDKKVEEGKIKETKEKTKDESFSGEIDDPSKPAKIITETEGGKTTRTYYNFKNIITSTKDMDVLVRDSINLKLTSKEKIKEGKRVNKQNKGKATFENTNKEVKVKRGFPWWILITIGVIYLIISFYKKAMNFLRWL